MTKVEYCPYVSCYKSPIRVAYENYGPLIFLVHGSARQEPLLNIIKSERDRMGRPKLTISGVLMLCIASKRAPG